jgi:hypothetical protein
MTSYGPGSEAPCLTELNSIHSMLNVSRVFEAWYVRCHLAQTITDCFSGFQAPKNLNADPVS